MCRDTIYKQNIKVNLKTCKAYKMKAMKQARYAFGLCYVGMFIYVVSGMFSPHQMENTNLEDSCERYNIIEN